jgi:hypothetical protein
VVGLHCSTAQLHTSSAPTPQAQRPPRRAGIISPDLLAVARAYIQRYESAAQALNLPLPSAPITPSSAPPASLSSNPQFEEAWQLTRRLRQFNSSYAGTPLPLPLPPPLLRPLLLPLPVGLRLLTGSWQLPS